jgi:hypothetical protein
MALNKMFGAILGTGGSSGALDSIRISVLTDGDMAIVGDSSEEAHIYRFESSSTASESDPQAIRPDDYSTSGVWILMDLSVEDLRVYGNAVIDGTLNQTGNVHIVGNVNINGTLTFDDAGPAVTVILDEDAMGSDSATALATQQSIKAYVDSQVAGITVDVDLIAGLLVRSRFVYKDANEIYIYPCRYHHDGTVETMLKADATLTFQIGVGGSNAANSATGTSQWQYLYIDDSALSGTALTAARLLNSTTAPAWSAAKLGWYGTGADNTTTNDKCIFAFYIDSGGSIEEFFHFGGREVLFADAYASRPSATLGTTWTDVTMLMPACGQEGIATFFTDVTGTQTDADYFWRTNGQTGSTGHQIGISNVRVTGDERYGRTVNQARVFTDSAQKIEVKSNSTDSDTKLTVLTDGFVLPGGM